ncbi:hypothetical protein; putative exported protein [Xenorhabdus bovienii str. feltiae Florida]|uniref:Uncharacterized protein n=3 Tax=Xenorhabdus bovienii TaxID=40576 RepID=A0A0B6XGA5_XENBV|nr:hypothetical protein; putative exported protein [Xenorhabdus bovienii str. feltiae Florida]CDH00972.1 hypothetical protein; putative exported protein [Xenorhabdus bovienii str. feltiae Moldova]CDM92098.1 conserved protein of unknown function [Xenorhabdus bovienii]
MFQRAMSFLALFSVLFIAVLFIAIDFWLFISNNVSLVSWFFDV